MHYWFYYAQTCKLQHFQCIVVSHHSEHLDQRQCMYIPDVSAAGRGELLQPPHLRIVLETVQRGTKYMAMLPSATHSKTHHPQPSWPLWPDTATCLIATCIVLTRTCTNLSAWRLWGTWSHALTVFPQGQSKHLHFTHQPPCLADVLLIAAIVLHIHCHACTHIDVCTFSKIM